MSGKSQTQKNYAQFKQPALSDRSTTKKPYLVTILKFKEGHSQLLQSIHTLDRILSNFTNSQSQDNNPSKQHQNNELNARSSSSSQNHIPPHIYNIYDNKNVPNRVRSSAQSYFNEQSRSQMHTNSPSLVDPNKNNNQIYYQNTNPSLVDTKQAATATNQNFYQQHNNYNQPTERLKSGSQTLPRPLSTFSVRDVNPKNYNTTTYRDTRHNTITSRHSLTPTTFSHMQQQTPVIKQQYGVFPVRSASRLSHTTKINNHLPVINNNSFDNISEISYNDYSKTIVKSQQRNKMEAEVNKGSSMGGSGYFVTNLRQPETSFQNQSLTRISRSPKSLIGVGGINPRSNSVSERGTSYARGGSASSITTEQQHEKEARHEYFGSRRSKGKDGNESSSLTERSNHHKSSNHQTTRTTLNIIKSDLAASTESQIDANLDIIKAELASLRIEREHRKNNSLVETSTTTTTKHITKIDATLHKNTTTTPTYIRPVKEQNNNTTLNTIQELQNKKPLHKPPTRLKEIIESFNNFDKKVQQTNNRQSNNKPLPKQQTSPETISHNEINDPTPSTLYTTTYNIINYNKDFVDTPALNNYPMLETDLETRTTPKPNVDGLINYFSNNANRANQPSSPPVNLVGVVSKKASPLSFGNIGSFSSTSPTNPDEGSSGSSSNKMQKFANSPSPFKVNYQLESRKASETFNFNQISTSLLESKPPDASLIAGRLDTEYYSKIFQQQPHESTPTTPEFTSFKTSPSSPQQSPTITTYHDLDHLTMSVDSLDNSIDPHPHAHSEANQITEPDFDQEIKNKLENELYNHSQPPEKEYDLATFGLDSNVVQGDIEPIFKPIVLQKRSKNQGGRRRTFANMIWPMSAEEERIMRSNSPFIVPEVIVSRSESLRGILKKGVSFDLVGNGERGNEMRRVGFGEKFAFVSVFERFEPDLVEQQVDVEMTNVGMVQVKS